MVMQRVTTFCVLLAFTATAFAQPEGGDGGRRRRGGEGRQGGGRGGFGGGMMMGRGMGAPLSPIQLSLNEVVQKDLEVKPEQVDKLKKLGEEYRTDAESAMDPVRKEAEGLRDLERSEREAKMADLGKKRNEIQKQLNAKFQPKLNEILEKPQQERLQQIGYQALRTGIFENADVVAKLGITKEQQEKIAAANKDSEAKRRELFADRDGDMQERMTKMREMDESHEKALEALLTDSQKEQLAQLKGKKFDLAALRPAFGGGRGGQGGGPNPGGRPRRPQGNDEKKADEKKSDEKPAEKKDN
ncbi:MAG: hypothetical protein U0903_09125 [Planctomycetales bacterium]